MTINFDSKKITRLLVLTLLDMTDTIKLQEEQYMVLMSNYLD